MKNLSNSFSDNSDNRRSIPMFFFLQIFVSNHRASSKQSIFSFPVMAEKDSCARAQCGSNAICRDRPQGVVCECQPGYFGNPYLSCRPECVLNSDCPATKTCINNKCEDPCRGACGVGSLCEPVNHFPVCLCPSGTSGDPFVSCSPVRPGKFQLK